MKKLLLASAIAALSVSAAQAAPTVYGKVFLTVDTVDGDVFGQEGTQLNNSGSRIGVKGSEALNSTTDVVYQLEYGVKPDDNNKSQQFKSRDTFLGLSNAQYGTLLAGRLTTIDDFVDFADVLEGENVAAEAGYAFDEERANNAFAYISPDYNGMQWYAMYGIDSDNDSGSLDNEDQFGLAVTFSPNDQMNAGASYIAHDENSYARISGNYAVTPELTVGALYQLSDVDTDDNEQAITLSGEMATATPWTVYGQVNLIDNVGGTEDAEAMGVGVGGKYKFNKATKGHLYAGYYDEDDGNNSEDGFGLGAGLEYKF